MYVQNINDKNIPMNYDSHYDENCWVKTSGIDAVYWEIYSALIRI